jgi:regulator of cell morphogenesis and NO signaling
MWKEENVLFPLIQRLEQSLEAGVQFAGGPSMIGPIQVMEFEHESAGNALVRMRSVTNGYQAPPDGCNTYRALMEGLRTLEADLHQHIHLENNILFPRALELEARISGA